MLLFPNKVTQINTIWKKTTHQINGPGTMAPCHWTMARL